MIMNVLIVSFRLKYLIDDRGYLKIYRLESLLNRRESLISVSYLLCFV